MNEQITHLADILAKLLVALARKEAGTIGYPSFYEEVKNLTTELAKLRDQPPVF